MPTTDSPLRYPGGKTQLTPFVVELLRANSLLGGIYAEPFAGGAGLALRLLLNGHVAEIWLNDIDPAIHALWHSVLNRTDELCELIDSTPVTMDEWHLQRQRLHDKRSGDLRRGFAALFLNRTNRSGILNGGVIGGKGQQSAYSLDCRFNKPELQEKIRRIAMYRDVIRLSRLDAVDCLRQWRKAFPRRGLINIDPPYYVQGRDLYLSYYEHADHESLRSAVRALKVPWILTYDDVPQIVELYGGVRLFRKRLLYSAQVKRHAFELLGLAPGLKLPPSVVPILQAA
jgi:DNA adenine methylase